MAIYAHQPLASQMPDIRPWPRLFQGILPVFSQGQDVIPHLYTHIGNSGHGHTNLRRFFLWRAIFGTLVFRGDRGKPRVTRGIHAGPRTLNWLRENESESVLASNRFGETQNAVQFVQQLYSAGAARVIIPLPAIQSDEVETYADSVVVSLPTDPAKRDRVWKLCAEELKARRGRSWRHSNRRPRAALVGLNLR